jgi:hypothetical protein
VARGCLAGDGDRVVGRCRAGIWRDMVKEWRPHAMELPARARLFYAVRPAWSAMQDF